MLSWIKHEKKKKKKNDNLGAWGMQVPKFILKFLNQLFHLVISWCDCYLPIVSSVESQGPILENMHHENMRI